MVNVIDKENPLKFSFCKEVFEKFGERLPFSWGEYFARSGDVMEMIVLFEQLYDQFLEFCSHTPAQRLSHQNEIVPIWVWQR